MKFSSTTKCSIVIPESATRTELFAAEELLADKVLQGEPGSPDVTIDAIYALMARYYLDIEEYEDRYYLFSADEVEAVNDVIKNVTPDIMPEAATLDYDSIVSVEACTKDLIFRSFVADICITGENYFVVVTEDEQTLMYKVPEEKRKIFEKIMKTVVDSQEEYFEEFGFDAVYVASGAGLPSFLKLEGESLNGVYSAM